ncbi:hypothetical protein ACQHIH_21935 (plasmid) [Xanthomonas sontii]|uniref:hypothetical protein n=1 Tax=Xanthomonas sontii TaxID=2650745 RepID=UPI003F82D2CA
MSQLTDIRYFPRKDLVEQVHQILISGLSNAITMFAARRMGKTLFVRNELLPAADAWRWRACYIDLWVRRDQPEQGLVEELEKAGRRQGALAKMKPSTMKAKAAYAGNEVEAEWKKEGSADDLQGRLRKAMRQLVLPGDQPVLLVIDEFQTLAQGKHEDFVAAFRATMLELQPKLKLFFTGSSRDALNTMFRKRKAPLFDSAMSLPLPELEKDFVEDRAEIFREMTGKAMDVEALSRVFDNVAHVPLYLNQIILHTVVSLTSDPWEGFRRWRMDVGEAGLREQWVKLKPVDRVILTHLANDRPGSLFSAEFSAKVTQAIGEPKPYTPQRIQTVVNRLVKSAVLAPKGGHGEYEIEDRALAIYIGTSVPNISGDT